MSKKKPKKRIIINGDLVAFAVKARKLHMTYGQLQVQETLERQKEEKAAAERLARRKGGGTGESEGISSASK